MTINEFTLTRRDFVKAGGALFVTLTMPKAFPGSTLEAAETTLDPTKLASWLEIRDDGTIVARTGRTETGTSASAFYAQVIAEELYVRPSSITMILGHTDETPEGGYSAGFLSGAGNLRKVAAYTYQALLGLAATRLNVPATSLSVTDGVVSGGGKTVSYSDLVKGQQFDLQVPVQGVLANIDPRRRLVSEIWAASRLRVTLRRNPFRSTPWLGHRFHDLVFATSSWANRSTAVM